MDNAGTLLRTIQYKGRTASLVIKVTQLNGVQKQVGLRCGCLRKAPLGPGSYRGCYGSDQQPDVVQVFHCVRIVLRRSRSAQFKLQ